MKSSLKDEPGQPRTMSSHVRPRFGLPSRDMANASLWPGRDSRVQPVIDPAGARLGDGAREFVGANVGAQVPSVHEPHDVRRAWGRVEVRPRHQPRRSKAEAADSHDVFDLWTDQPARAAG